MNKGESRAYLGYKPGTLTISLGATSDELAASGSWPSLVSVPSKWVKALAVTPINAPVTDLRVHNGKLWARNNGVSCTVHEGEGSAETPVAGTKRRRASS